MKGHDRCGHRQRQPRPLQQVEPGADRLVDKGRGLSGEDRDGGIDQGLPVRNPSSDEVRRQRRGGSQQDRDVRTKEHERREHDNESGRHDGPVRRSQCLHPEAGGRHGRQHQPRQFNHAVRRNPARNARDDYRDDEDRRDRRGLDSRGKSGHSVGGRDVGTPIHMDSGEANETPTGVIREVL